MPFTYPHIDVDNKLFTTNMASGGAGGKPFAFIGVEKGALLTKIKAWRVDWRIRGVEVWMSDGTSKLFGCRVGDSREFSFEVGELITSLNSEASGETSSGGYRRLGAIWFSTSKNREWGIFSNNLENEGVCWMDVGSGYCCGIFGAGGSDVDRLGFAMLRDVKSCRLVDVEYPNLDEEPVSTTPEIIASETFTNDTSLVQEFTLKGKKTYTELREWGISTTLEYQLAVEIQAGIPGLLDATTKAQWKVGVTGNYKRSTQKVKEDSWSWPIKCPPGETIKAEATLYGDTIETEYTAKLELKLANGAVYKFDREGMYVGALVRLGNIHIYKMNNTQ